jgi:hypothetical protein
MLPPPLADESDSPARQAGWGFEALTEHVVARPLVGHTGSNYQFFWSVRTFRCRPYIPTSRVCVRDSRRGERYDNSMSQSSPGLTALERMYLPVDNVRGRLLRATATLDKAGVPYAVAGGNAVADWVTRIDSVAVRFTQDVDLLLRRSDLDAATAALQSAGFVRKHIAGIELFLDGPNAKARDAVHIVFAGEKVRPEYMLPAPDVFESDTSSDFRVLTLDALVRMKLTSFRRKDQVHLLDMLDVGLIDASWCGRFPLELAARLQHLIETPDA